MPQNQPIRGFTLLELLVAIAIFSLLSAIAYSGVQSILRSRETLDDNMTRLAQLQRTVLSLGNDLRQATQRGIRDEYGDTKSPLISNASSSDIEIDGIRLELTHAGYPNPLGVTRSNLQRVAYAIEEGSLYRLTWTDLDRAPDSLPHKARLCDAINALSFRFLDYDRNWHDQWPPLQSQGVTALPLAVEVTLELADWGDITRLYSLAGES
jgi:general secretion pathway protein J